MDKLLFWLGQSHIQLILAIWFVVVGLSSFVYVGYEQFRRSRRLRRFGLSEKATSKASDVQTAEEVTKYVTNLFAASHKDVAEKFIAAGFYNTRFAHLYLSGKYLLLLIGGALIATAGIYLGMTTVQLAVAVVGWAIVTIIVPDAYLDMRTKSLQKKLSNQLPYLLDLMGVCVQTGMTIEAAMSYLSQEMAGFDRDLAYMLKRTNDRAHIVGLEQALEELYKRVPTTEIRSFVMTLNQSLQYGSSIYTVLTTLAVDIREVQMLNLEEKIGKLSAKMSVPLILFIMIPIVILITAPGVMRMMGG
ncbi:biotin synthase [Vibrio sp. HA2012]|uniref:type II secretion system F family protein n=1 Tax=Vibrio sp. HA2012 TaxID=1971595 RepID=UPI000C2B8D39|nr:type II secretion system F family protein [Vibrio sp. HA2012]PJC86107.1 biotin synthase [Vibrio sp. HA2012]